MNIHNLLENQFREAASQAGGCGTLLLSTDDGDLQCAVSEVNPIACRLQRMSYYSERIAGASVEALEQLGHELSQRLSYLMEPLAPMEIDREAAVVQLRSAPPERDEGEVRYFEVLISRQRGLHLQRYQAVRGANRLEIPTSVTKETLERLIKDCIDTTKSVLS